MIHIPIQENTDVDVLKYYLDSHDVSQQDLSDTISTSRVALNQVLNGKRGVTPLMALKLEAALGVPAKEILMKQLLADLDKTYTANESMLEHIRERSKFRDLPPRNGGATAPAEGT